MIETCWNPWNIWKYNPLSVQSANLQLSCLILYSPTYKFNIHHLSAKDLNYLNTNSILSSRQLASFNKLHNAHISCSPYKGDYRRNVADPHIKNSFPKAFKIQLMKIYPSPQKDWKVSSLLINYAILQIEGLLKILCIFPLNVERSLNEVKPKLAHAIQILKKRPFNMGNIRIKRD